MLKFLFRAAAVAALVSVPVSASALMTATVLNSTTQGIGNTAAQPWGAKYGAFDLGGTFAPSPGINIEVGSVSGAAKSPWSGTNTPLATNRAYFSVQANNFGTELASANPVTLTLASAQTAFQILWGSIDDYNKIEFFNGATSVGSWTGSAIAALTPATGCGSPSNFECVKEVLFTGDTFTSISFASVGRNSFEFGTIPLPAAAWLLLGVAGALVAAKRRSSLRAA